MLVSHVFLQGSQCVFSEYEKRYLYALLKNRRLITTLLYQGSRDGFYTKDFHRMCDGKGPTITLFKVENGACIGGYTEEQWRQSPHSKYISDPKAFLFNLKKNKQYLLRDRSVGILCRTDRGPAFSGRGFADLAALTEPFN